MMSVQTVGILGGGQLARMLSLAAYPLGLSTLCFETKAGTSAHIVSKMVVSDFNNTAALIDFAKQVDVITFETENIPVTVASLLAEHCSVYPSIKALAIAQDRWQEKTLCQSLGLKTAAFMAVDSHASLAAAVAQLGLPAVLKTCRMGYDGKGQYVLKQQQDIDAAWQQLGGQALILEKFVLFECEVSLLAVRDSQGNIAYYPLSHNQHQNGILRLSLAPYSVPALQTQAQIIATKILDALNYVGLLAIEFFQVGDELWVNELAPRVHNSGHWTIEGASTSQFENHIRAISGLPLGTTDALGYSAMVNCIGGEPNINDILAIPCTHYHSYHKTPVVARKLAHITVNALEKTKFDTSLARVQQLVEAAARG